MNEVIFLKCLIHFKQVCRQLFIKMIEEGTAQFIPLELSQDSLPQSFRYYDHIIACLDEQMSLHKKQTFMINNCVSFQLYKNSDLKTNLLEKVGLGLA